MNIIDFILNLFKKSNPNIKEWHDGLVPSPVDYRDAVLGATQEMTPLPESYIIPYILRVHTQGTKPICVGETGSLMKEEKERRERNFIDFDGEWLYNECKKIDGIPNVQGTYFRAMLKVLTNTGAKPIGGLDIDAGKYKIGGYAQVNCDIESIKSGITQNGVILSAFYGSNGGWQNQNIRPVQNEEVIWGHATGGIGWKDKNTIIGQNSWGESWGDKGKFYYTKDYLPFEAWAILVDRPNILGTEKPTYQFNNNLSYGMTSVEVDMLQKCLKSIGCFPIDKDTTEYFGQITIQAVKNFQQRYGIIQTGLAGPSTRSKLNELFSQ